MNQKFKGVYAALTTPFVDDEISCEKFRDNIQKFNETGLDGYVVLGSTGECVFLTEEESDRLVETAREAAPGKKIIVGTARESTRLTIEATDRAALLGADAVLVRPPSYFKSRMDREALKKHYLAVADRAKLPVILYNIPQNTGISLDPSLVIELSRHPNIAGIKDSSGNLANLGETLLHLDRPFSFLVGAGSVFFPALVMGASGGILAVANAAPLLCVRIHELFSEGRLEEAGRLQLELVPLNKTLTESYGISAIKYSLDLLDFYGGPMRLPLLPLNDQKKNEVAALLKKNGLLRD